MEANSDPTLSMCRNEALGASTRDRKESPYRTPTALQNAEAVTVQIGIIPEPELAKDYQCKGVGSESTGDELMG
jgi:hypothetical protein